MSSPQEHQRRLKVGSLFAGIGGFDLGFERAGFEVAWCVEWDKHAQAVLRKRFPNATIYGDIKTVDPSMLQEVDVICGGFPCQDLSVAGKRQGLTGERSRHFYDAIRIVRYVQPKLLVLENVPGLLSSNHGLDFAAVIREVGEGWPCEEVAWRVLDSQFFGVAQRRRRVFVVAGSRIGYAESVLALSEGVCWHPEPRNKAGKDTSAAAGERASESVVAIQGTLIGRDAGGPHGVGAQADAPMYTLTKTDKHGVAYRKSKRAQTETDDETWVDDGRANTLNGFYVGDTRTTHAVVAATTVRRLTPTECERLQGFPDGWTQIGDANPTADSHRYKQLGNAVTVNVAEWIARRAMKCLTPY